jgi:hypothetical protein
MQPGFYLSVILELVCFSLLVIATIMADDPAPKRVRRALGTVCEARGKHFDTSDGFDKHRTSGYLVGTPCHDDEFMLFVGWKALCIVVSLPFNAVWLAVWLATAFGDSDDGGNDLDDDLLDNRDEPLKRAAIS